MLTKTRATVEDLYNAPGKAELVNGELVEFMATGINPAKSGRENLLKSPERHEDETGRRRGLALIMQGFLVDLPNRESFSPDVAWIVGEAPDTMKFGRGAPALRGRSAQRKRLRPSWRNDDYRRPKSDDYFAAGTLVVWDVDLLGSDAVIRKYRSDAPDHPTVFARDEEADAEPAVPGWRFPVSRLFR